MSIDFDTLFPEQISDEAAAALTDVLFALALACESRYFTRLLRFHARRPEPVDPEQPWRRARDNPDG